MCTSIDYQTIDGYTFLSRTLDYDDSVSEEILVIPRFYQWNQCENRRSKYAVLGLGLEAQNDPMLYDGINEKGLMCAILYFDQACYNPFVPGKDNLKSYDFALWALSQYSSVDEVLAHLDTINVTLGIVNQIPSKLHWILSDSTCRTVVIENTNGFKVYEGWCHALANEPDFPTQLGNLNRYHGVNPMNTSLGLPGDFTSCARFIRAAYCRQRIDGVYGELNGVTNVFKILDTVQVQKGVDCDENQVASYTHATSCMCANSRTYYYTSYGNRQINALCLLNEDLNAPILKRYPLNRNQSIHQVN